MSPEEGEMLLREVAPRLCSAIPHAVRHVGSEDSQELLQDGLAMAAKILTNAHKNGKKVTPGNVAYYTLQHLKSGRRTVGYSNADVLGSATQLNGRSTLASIDEDVNLPGDGDGVIPVAEVMCRDEEDPSMQAARKMDWECFVASRDGGDQALLQCLGEGWTTIESSHRLRISALTIRTRLTQLRQSLLEFFGEAMMSEAIRKPQWFHDLRVAKEHFACRSERSWQMQ